MSPHTRFSRRRFLETTALIGAAQTFDLRAAQPIVTLDVGVNTSSLARQIRSTEANQRIDPFDLPTILRDEVDVRVIDLVHTTLNTRDRATLERFRARTEAAGCVITNLKVNAQDLPFNGDDPAARRRALDEYKLWIDAAAILGTR
ncbi:MAG: hypothetical protein V4773_21610 [Verrucomicrobiota bacterium]